MRKVAITAGKNTGDEAAFCQDKMRLSGIDNELLAGWLQENLGVAATLLREGYGIAIFNYENKAKIRGLTDTPSRRPNGIESIAAERLRQVDVEGWTPEHDDQHANGELAGAAAVYALYRSQVDAVHLMGEPAFFAVWPFDGSWLKPKSAREDLVRAGALIAAEIDRLDRVAVHQSQGE